MIPTKYLVVLSTLLVAGLFPTATAAQTTIKGTTKTRRLGRGSKKGSGSGSRSGSGSNDGGDDGGVDLDARFSGLAHATPEQEVSDDPVDSMTKSQVR